MIYVLLCQENTVTGGCDRSKPLFSVNLIVYFYTDFKWSFITLNASLIQNKHRMIYDRNQKVLEIVHTNSALPYI